MAFIYLIVAFVLNAAANILLKVSALRGLKIVKGPEIITGNLLFIGGLVLFAVNVLFYFLALRSIPLSSAYPIMVGASFLLVNTYAFFGLSERIGMAAITGYALIIAGIVVILSAVK